MPNFDQTIITRQIRKSVEFDKKEALSERQVLHEADFPVGIIKERSISGNLLQKGVSTDLPDGSSHVKMFYEEDTKKLKIWNATNGSWDEVQFS